MKPLRCLLGFHEEYVLHAKDRQEDECTRWYADDRASEPVDGCTLVFACRRCNADNVDEIPAPASTADREDLWRDSA